MVDRNRSEHQVSATNRRDDTILRLNGVNQPKQRQAS
jgi:hypothetical protein